MDGHAPHREVPRQRQTATFEQRPVNQHRQLERLRPDRPEPARPVRGGERSATTAAWRCPASRSTARAAATRRSFPATTHRSASTTRIRRGRLGREQPDLRQRHDDRISHTARTKSVNSATALRHTLPGARTSSSPDDPRRRCRTSNGFADFPSSSRIVADDLSRFNVNADITRYGSWRGQHTRQGRPADRAHRERVTLSASRRATVQLFWDRALVANDGRRVRGTYGYYNVTQRRSPKATSKQQRRPVRAGRVDGQPAS